MRDYRFAVVLQRVFHAFICQIETEKNAFYILCRIYDYSAVVVAAAFDKLLRQFDRSVIIQFFDKFPEFHIIISLYFSSLAVSVALSHSLAFAAASSKTFILLSISFLKSSLFSLRLSLPKASSSAV